MLQRFLVYLTAALFLVGAIYLVALIWWLFLPFFFILLLFAAFRVYQARKMWHDLIKQAQKTQTVHKHSRKVSDDNVIDVDYEEIKS